MSRARRLKLRRPDTCVICRVSLTPGTVAFWDADAKAVTCLACLGTPEASVNGIAAAESGSGTPAFDRGTAGESSLRRYEHLHERREQRARDRYGRLSGIYLAVTHDPQSTIAWSKGGRGERLLGKYLDTLHDETSAIVLHDRRIPGTRANIDHIAVTRNAAVWAIDAKNYTGKVRRVDKGSWFSTDPHLHVGRRDCTKLVPGMTKQVEAIRVAIGQPLIEEFGVAIRAGLCFVDAEWSLFARPFTLNGVWIGWPKALGDQLRAAGDLEREHLMLLARKVAAALPPA
jgi:hypothetical protein